MRQRRVAEEVLVSAERIGSGRSGDEAAVAERLAHARGRPGAAGRRAIAGYRLGERALKELGLPGTGLDAPGRTPLSRPGAVASRVAGGLGAATGASPGELNLRVEEAAADATRTVIRDRKSGRVPSFTLKPEFMRSVMIRPHDRLEAEGRRAAAAMTS